MNQPLGSATTFASLTANGLLLSGRKAELFGPLQQPGYALINYHGAEAPGLVGVAASW
jgi:hypothetical protein